VDDEPRILTSIQRAIVGEGFEALFAASGREALDMFIDREIAVLVTDMRMPSMDGLTLLKLVREISPKTVRIVLSGFTQVSQILATVNQADIFRFIPKPWEMEEELLSAVRQAIEHYELEAERDGLRDSITVQDEAYQNVNQKIERILDNEQKYLAVLRRVNNWTYAFAQQYITQPANGLAKKQEPLLDYLSLFNELATRYLSALPMVPEEKSLALTLNEIETECNWCVEISSSVTSEDVCTGHHAFLIFVIRSLVSVFTTGPETKVKCNVKMQANTAGNSTMFFELHQPLPASSAPVEDKLQAVCSLLAEMSRSYDISVLAKNNGEKGTVIQITWQVAVS